MSGESIQVNVGESDPLVHEKIIYREFFLITLSRSQILVTCYNACISCDGAGLDFSELHHGMALRNPLLASQ